MNLNDPFPASTIHWRVGATNSDKSQGIALAYLDARDVMDRLDECMPGLWQCRYPWSDGKRVCCEIGIYNTNEWMWRSDGAGETDYEGDKGAFSDAFKRAAVRWGIGRYLYDLPNAWVPIEQRGKSYVFSKETQKQLTERFAQWQEKKYGQSV